tara:strand:- start:842 stop:1564 length:723 start_codon:yes stop_codon:yes gene_type:complete
MIKKTSKLSEFKHFKRLAEEWWDPNGKYKILHKLNPIRLKYIKEIIKKNNINSKSLNNLSLLDLGCGGGLICEPLSRLGIKVTGIDFVKENIKIAKDHAKKSDLRINYVYQDLENLKIKKKFDIILMLEVIEHLDDFKRIINTNMNLLKPNGKLILSTINRTFLSKIFAILIAENILKIIPKNTHSYEKLIKPEELIDFLNNNGFKVIDTTGLIFNPISREWLLNKNNLNINYFCSAIKN